MTVETKIEPRGTNGARRSTPTVAQIRAIVVGDEPAMGRLIKEVLEVAEIEVVALTNRAEAAARFQREKFDLIFLDVDAPSEVEATMIRDIRSSGFNQKTVVIMISDDRSRDALPKAFEAGASVLAFKPIDRSRLTRLIRATQGTIEQEKRRFRRVPVRTTVRLKRGGTEVEGVTIDVSLNGALVDAPQTFPLGSMVELNICILFGLPPIVGRGAVTRIVDGNRMGIRFEPLDLDESARLQEYLLRFITGETS